MTSRVYKATGISQLCDAALAGIEAERKFRWNREIENWIKNETQARLLKSKFRLNNLFPVRFIEPTHDEAENELKQPRWRFDSKYDLIFQHLFTKVEQRIKRIRDQANSDAVNETMIVDVEDYAALTHWSKNTNI